MKLIVMKNLRQLVMIGAFIFLASLSAFAQKDNDQKKNPPPKEGKPPVVIVGDRNRPPKENPPKENPKPKKPDDYFE